MELCRVEHTLFWWGVATHRQMMMTLVCLPPHHNTHQVAEAWRPVYGHCVQNWISCRVSMTTRHFKVPMCAHILTLVYGNFTKIGLIPTHFRTSPILLTQACQNILSVTTSASLCLFVKWTHDITVYTYRDVLKFIERCGISIIKFNAYRELLLCLFYPMPGGRKPGQVIVLSMQSVSQSVR